jgi:hypothetical protein
MSEAEQIALLRVLLWIQVGTRLESAWRLLCLAAASAQDRHVGQTQARCELVSVISVRASQTHLPFTMDRSRMFCKNTWINTSALLFGSKMCAVVNDDIQK